MKGRINSFQSMGAVDGPGVRFVIFMQGCPLRCVYCHNPETWSAGGEGSDAGQVSKIEYDIEEVLEKIRRFRPYFGGGSTSSGASVSGDATVSGGASVSGGVTVSGGEPLLQRDFVAELFRRLQEEGIHTALDTSGISGAWSAPATGNPEGIRNVLKYTDLVLCDLKFPTEEEYRRNCGGSLEEVLAFLKLTEQMQVPLWIRHVVVPGLTDSDESLSGIVKIADRFSNLEKIELLPFKKLCMTKYEAMGLPFPLAGSEECPDVRIDDLYRKITRWKI